MRLYIRGIEKKIAADPSSRRLPKRNWLRKTPQPVLSSHLSLKPKSSRLHKWLEEDEIRGIHGIFQN
ncbi:MAG: hypothetical protein M1540_08020 [Candidatus Bathyarchaeota archaeon]|nr:hypothetical protein [Candidatus Bathyarchaeota archaeon]